MPRCTRCSHSFPDEFFEPPLSLCLPCYAAVPANIGLSEEQLRDKARKSRAARRRGEEPFARRASQIKNIGQFFKMLDKSSKYRSDLHTKHKSAIEQLESSDSSMPSWMPSCDNCGGKDSVHRIEGQVNSEGKDLLLCKNCSETLP